jgi:hypothetical protein
MMNRRVTRSWDQDLSAKFPNGKKAKIDSSDGSSMINKKDSQLKRSAESLKEIIFKYDTDPYDFDDSTLVDAALMMFKHYKILDKFSFSESVFRNFILRVRSFYNPNNLFHNFKHVWGVLHICFQILTHGGESYLTPLDIFAVMVAALCHDIQHPGNNNAFEAATSSDLSKMLDYSGPGAGILEWHHASITQELLNANGTDYDILVGLTKKQKHTFCRQIGLIILGTDMAKHAGILAEAVSYTASSSSLLQQQLEATSCASVELSGEPSCDINARKPKSSKNGTKSTKNKNDEDTNSLYAEALPRMAGAVDKSDPEWRLCFTRVLVHTADIGAQTQGSAVARKWMDRCYGEFRSQAEKEELLGIMTSPFLHDLKEDSKTLSAQLFFIEHTVEPLWGAMASLLPKLTFALEQLRENKQLYQEMLEKYLLKHKISPAEISSTTSVSKPRTK